MVYSPRRLRGTRNDLVQSTLNCSKHTQVKVLVTQSCPTLCDPVVCSLPGSSVHT